MPVVITAITVVWAIGYLIVTKQLISSMKNVPKSSFVLIACVLALISSIFYKNIDGIFISFGFIVVSFLMFFYRTNVDKKMFYLMIKISTIMSLFVACLAVYQFINIVNVHPTDHMFLIGDKPDQRVTGVFFNANYYATIIEYVVLMCVYKLIVISKRPIARLYYNSVIIVNLLMLYLTGCRSAWIAIFLAIPIMFLFKNQYRNAVIAIFLEENISILLLFTNVFPRIDTMTNDAHTRMDIWHIAYQGIVNHPLFGMGPHAYKILLPQVMGPHKRLNTIHAHSLYLEMFLTFGIIGMLLLSVYMIDYIKLYMKSSYQKSYSFIIGVVVATLVHGITDVTIINLQTGLLFIFIISTIGLRDNSQKFEY